jgi:hypothetical protein
MRIEKVINDKGMIQYYFFDFEEPKHFFKIDKKIRKIKELKIKVIDNVKGFSFLMKKYSINDAEIYLYNEHMLGNFLTVKVKKDENILEMLVDKLRTLEI